MFKDNLCLEEKKHDNCKIFWIFILMNPYHHYILTGLMEENDDLSSVKQEECS
jgi:hypothetical protein